MSACIGWEGDTPCPRHGQFHGCDLGDKHPGRHVCACGAVGRVTTERTPASHRGATNQHRRKAA